MNEKNKTWDSEAKVSYTPDRPPWSLKISPLNQKFHHSRSCGVLILTLQVFKAAVSDDTVKAAPVKLCKTVDMKTEGSMSDSEKAKLSAMIGSVRRHGLATKNDWMGTVTVGHRNFGLVRL